MKTKYTHTEILSFTEEDCRIFLRNNYGTRGVNGQGITKKPEQQTIDNLRLECICQNYYNQTQNI